MKPTIPWMQENFDFLNDKYFGGRLHRPSFGIMFDRKNWGYYMPNGDYNRWTRKFYQEGTGEIYLNGNFSRSEHSLQETLLHEMIHMYINTVMKLYPRDPHGDEFNNFAFKFNQDGWNISEETEMIETDVDGEDDPENNPENDDLVIAGAESYVFCILEQPTHSVCKFWAFKADEQDLEKFIATCRSLKDKGVTKLNIYKCNLKQFNNLPSSSEKLLGVGADDIRTLFSYVSQIVGVRISNNNIELINTIQI